jgi:hypothetical protein
MDGIFESNPPLSKQEKIMTTSNSLEGEAYDWYLWWSKKCDARSFNWQNFTAALLKRFHDEEDDDLYNKFMHLKQKASVNDYTHEWEVSATRQRGFTDEQLLKMYICGLKELNERLKVESSTKGKI